MNKSLKYLIFAALVAAAAFGIFIPLSDKSRSDYRLDKFDLSEVSGINNTTDWKRRFKLSPVPHIILQKKNTDMEKYVFSTADCDIIKHGYINRVELFVVFDHQGKIEDVILGRNIETPSLIKKMLQSGFFRQWSARSKSEKIHYVTGATFSCKAVDEGVAALLKLLKRENFFR